MASRRFFELHSVHAVLHEAGAVPLQIRLIHGTLHWGKSSSQPAICIKKGTFLLSTERTVTFVDFAGDSLLVPAEQVLSLGSQPTALAAPPHEAPPPADALRVQFQLLGMLAPRELYLVPCPPQPPARAVLALGHVPEAELQRYCSRGTQAEEWAAFIARLVPDISGYLRITLAQAALPLAVVQSLRRKQELLAGSDAADAECGKGGEGEEADEEDDDGDGDEEEEEGYGEEHDGAHKARPTEGSEAELSLLPDLPGVENSSGSAEAALSASFRAALRPKSRQDRAGMSRREYRRAVIQEYMNKRSDVKVEVVGAGSADASGEVPLPPQPSASSSSSYAPYPAAPTAATNSMPMPMSLGLSYAVPTAAPTSVFVSPSGGAGAGSSSSSSGASSSGEVGAMHAVPLSPSSAGTLVPVMGGPCHCEACYILQQQALAGAVHVPVQVHSGGQVQGQGQGLGQFQVPPGMSVYLSYFTPSPMTMLMQQPVQQQAAAFQMPPGYHGGVAPMAMSTMSTMGSMGPMGPPMSSTGPMGPMTLVPSFAHQPLSSSGLEWGPAPPQMTATEAAAASASMARGQQSQLRTVREYNAQALHNNDGWFRR